MKLKFGLTILALAVAMSLLALPSASGGRFQSDSPMRIPFTLRHNLIYVQGRVNERPMTLVLDTGAPHLIDTRRAKVLGLKLKPAGKGGGAGEADVDLYTSEDVTFSFPGLTLSGAWVGVVPLENVEECVNKMTVDREGKIVYPVKAAPGAARQIIDGVLGHDFFMKYVVEIDYVSRHLTMYEPASYKYSGAGEIIPIEIDNNHIYARAQITPVGRSPVNVRLLVDTGMATAFALNSPFIKKQNLSPQTQPAIPIPVCGIGGHSNTLMSTFGDLQVGKLKIANPVTLFSQARNGSLASTRYDGFIGNALMSHYKVVFDYSRGQMIWEAVK